MVRRGPKKENAVTLRFCEECKHVAENEDRYQVNRINDISL